MSKVIYKIISQYIYFNSYIYCFTEAIQYYLYPRD